jgi:hypothetical protein
VCATALGLLALRCSGESIEALSDGGVTGSQSGRGGKYAVGGVGIGGAGAGTGGADAGGGKAGDPPSRGGMPANGGEGGWGAEAGDTDVGGNGGSTPGGGRSNSGGVGGEAGDGAAGDGAAGDGGGVRGPITCGGSVTSTTVRHWVADEDALWKLAGIRTFYGDLYIETDADLAPLQCLTRVEGTLSVRQWGGVTLEPLSALEEVTGSLALYTTATSFAGLGSLERVGGGVALHGFNYIDLTGFSALRSIGGDLSLGGAFKTTHGFPLLETIGGSFAIWDGTQFETLDGFDALTEIGGDLVLIQNWVLTSLQGLRSLERIGGAVVLGDNVELRSLDGLESLREVGGLILRDGITDLSALSGVTTVPGEIEIRTSLPYDLDGLHNIVSVGGDVYLSGDYASVVGLRSLTTVGGNLSIGTPYLETLDGLGALQSVGGKLSVGGTALEDLEGLGAVSVRGAVTVGGNLRTVNGIEGVTFGSSLMLVAMNEAVDLEALSGLTTIPGDLVIRASRGIVSLEGLRNLKSVQGNVVVEATCQVFYEDNPDDYDDDPVAVTVCSRNAALTSLRGLRGITSIGNDLTIRGNPVLPACDAEWLRDHVGVANIGGTVTLLENTGVGSCPQ